MEEADYFITTWKTTTSNESITIPGLAVIDGYSVDWGDGNRSRPKLVSYATHTYVNPGTYKVKISGKRFNISFGNLNSSQIKRKIISIDQWGKIEWETMNRAFKGCSNMQIKATDVPDLASVKSMAAMFQYTNFSSDLTGWDVSNVESMTSMFQESSFNGNINGWNVSNVLSMRTMFWEARSFNQDISGWKVNSVTDTSSMFVGVAQFNADISNWDVSNVTNMSGMFVRAKKFNRDLSKWGDKLSKVTNMSSMFWNATLFNADISNWNVSSVTNMSRMFNGATSFNIDIGSWNVNNVKDMSGMFAGATEFNADISNWDVSSVENMSAMFSRAIKFTINLKSWGNKLGKVSSMISMFFGATQFNGDISDWKVSNVANMSNMFAEAIGFNRDISRWNVSNVANMSGMFARATQFNGDISGWQVSNVTNMSRMFAGAKLSQENYDKLLVGWSKLTLKENVPFDAGNSTFCKELEARTKLINQFKWSIRDKGQACIGVIDINKSIISAIPASIDLSRGNSTRIVIQGVNKEGQALTFGGEAIRIASSIGVIKETIDHRDGTYTAILSSSSGNGTVSFYNQEEKSMQSVQVTFYIPSACKVDFKIETNQTIIEAKGRYKMLSDNIEGPPIDVLIREEDGREVNSFSPVLPKKVLIEERVLGELSQPIPIPLNSWINFEIEDVENPSTPVIDKPGSYNLEVMVKGANGTWTEWHSVLPFFYINRCEKLNGISIEIFNGGCYSEVQFRDTVFVDINSYKGIIQNGMILYNDIDLTSKYNGNDTIFTNGVALGEGPRRSRSNFGFRVNYEFNVSKEGLVYNLRPCFGGES